MSNPYKATAKVLRVAWNIIFYGLLGLFALTVFVALVAQLWPFMGAWALTIPLLLVVTLVAFAAIIALSVSVGYRIAEWWNSKSRKWERDNA